MSKTIRLGTRLRYPITVVSLLKSPGDKIKKQEPLMEYSFKWMKEVGDKIRGETWEEEQTTIVPWESPTDGELSQWHIAEGQGLHGDGPCFVVKEDCPHSVQFQGLCGLCGKDMTEVNWAAETRETDRAPINMVHDQTNLMVSAGHAQRVEQELQTRLIQSRKLSLVVDLDQTVIQACIDPTVGEWQNDPTNPNHESVKEVKSFQLEDGPYGLARRCSYYIKMRPGLARFLERISDMYELHVYTMGTRAYAQNVAHVLDPGKKLFGNRVISRDENGNIFTKSLQRLFPVSTHMVVIIDDRSDVWPRNRSNLIKVSPYEFFKGIGDINSSFLPKRQDLLTSTTNGVAKAGKKKEAAAKADKADAAARAAIANMSGTEDAALTQQQLEEQERTFEKQIKDRPLQVLQEKLDREDEEAEKATTNSEDGSESRSSSPPPHRHRVLQDDDDELKYLERHLTFLHQTYFAQYDDRRAQHHTLAANVDLTSVPDAGRILDDLKADVLGGCSIVLSGVLPRGVDIHKSEIGQQIASFGAQLRTRVRGDVTHLVVNTSQPGSEKLLEARRRPHIKIVSQEWLGACFRRWAAVDETPYLFTARLVEEGGGAGNGHHASRGGDAAAGLESEEDEEDDVGGADAENRAPASHGGGIRRKDAPRLRLVSASGQTRDVHDDDDDDDDDDGDEEADADLLPDDLEGQLSPIDGLKTFNWGSADAELNEFLASGSSDEDEDEEDEEEDEDEDEDEDAAQPARLPDRISDRPSRKRKSRDEDAETDPGAESEPSAAADDDGLQQAKRLKESPRVSSSLRNQYPSAAGGGMQNGEADADADADAEEEEEIDIDEAELEAMFEAGFDTDTGTAGDGEEALQADEGKG
ncbi:hypothetical protein BT67DRAFT_491349 [Trichocladium antarcticum]|uniref:RNA polymerase II subunit A C-terminal domain phosphatase n=1 Tax=Trichocladium antarcticum TaxID=1450529 RepID=A0AAN6UNT3_9PEZI|nr:hypothetical protein BT67DRAFT_491349 [Trichocladium antarcticum]